MKRLKFIALFGLLLANVGFAQDKPSKFQVRGYLKYMQTTSFVDGLDSIITGNFLHNRLNFRYNPLENLTFGADVRTRFFWGESVRLQPGFADALDRDSGLVDLSFVPVRGNNAVMHTILDRAWVDWYKGKWQIRAGRQRINWGINTVWNPNDIFNAYSYFDFDYEERPGSDAVRIQYFPGDLSKVELAVSPGKSLDETVAAMLWRFNKWNYDFQVLGGLAHTDVALGAGWAGGIKQIGFKGEATYFQPRENFADTSGVLSASLGFDYVFPSTFFVSLGGLYNSSGSSTPFLGNFVSANLSAKSLSPFKYTLFASAGYPVNPLLSANMGLMVSPTDGTMFLMPSATYSVANNWDIMLLGQLLYGDPGFGLGYRGLGQSVFLRVKWSF